MQTQAIVSRLLQCCVPFMHAARWRALHDVATAACGKSLTLTTLALGTTRNTRNIGSGLAIQHFPAFLYKCLVTFAWRLPVDFTT